MNAPNVFRNRLKHLNQFYAILGELERSVGGAVRLSDCSGRISWPQKGVYFFQEVGEDRSDTGPGPRIVRVGTHALKAGSTTRLWTRLSQHKGPSRSGGGNHRGSIFRLIVGAALMNANGYVCPTWGQRSSAAYDIRAGEADLEERVSHVIGAMPFLWLSVEDDAGPESERSYIERNRDRPLEQLRQIADRSSVARLAWPSM